MRSIRWRLTASYAGIALLTAFALGAVLLGVLRATYREREREYLERSAAMVAQQLAQPLGLPSEATTSQVEGYSFLAQARVRLLDERGRVVADSGKRSSQQLNLMVERVPGSPEGTATPRAFRTLVSVGGVGVSASAPAAGSLSLDEAVVSGDPESRASGPRVEKGLVGDVDVAPPLGGERIVTVGPGEEASGRVIVSSRSAVSGFYGFGLGEPDLANTRSDQTLRAEYRTSDGARGVVELSEGPAYGTEIVRLTAMGWTASSLVAVLLAAFAGTVVSRRLSAPVVSLTGVTRRMASGDLAARAEEASRDEIGTLARSFNHMAEEVEVTVETLRRFVSDAAHELNTPLTALHANLELAERSDAPPDAVGRAREQVERLRRLTRDMLDLSRVESGAGLREPLDLSALARESADAFASRAEQAGVRLELEVPEDEVLVGGDRTQLANALGNLLDNALKFTPAGGFVRVGLAADDEVAELTVTDSGIGIPEADMPALFSRFHRGRNAAGYPGSGLGLAIVKAIAEAHGGRVVARSGAEGTRVVMRVGRVT